MKRSERPGDRQRVDLLLVERGLAPSREKAQALVLAGVVSAAGRNVAKAGTLVPRDAELHVAPGRRFVSRGGDKLEGALESLGLDVAGIEACDVGASTGGFTDCLLQRGAKRVVALDVGRGQLDWSLRNDPRVTVVEGVNVRYLETQDFGRFDLIVVDVSFISLGLVLPVLAPLLRERTGPGPLPALLVLVKPQFELGRGSVGRGGIVRDPAKHLEAILKVVRAAAGSSHSPAGKEGETFVEDDELAEHDPAGGRSDPGGPRSHVLGVWAIVESPIRGAEGNREFFVHLVAGHARSLESIEEEARRVAGAEPPA